MLSRAKIFDRVLRDIAVPELIDSGFHFDGSRTFRKINRNAAVAQIINFQLGQRSIAGKFTVNFGVFHEGDFSGVGFANACEYDCIWSKRTRIGQIIPSKLSPLQAIPFIGWLFGTPDRWWKFSEDEQLTRKNIGQVLSYIKCYGIAWLDSKAANKE